MDLKTYQQRSLETLKRYLKCVVEQSAPANVARQAFETITGEPYIPGAQLPEPP